MDLSRFRDPELAGRLVEVIARLAPDRDVNLMEVCGTHTVAIARGGLPSVLPEQVHLLSGPGCPVCVTANRDIDSIIALARRDDVTLTTFGDMVRVPGSSSSLLDEKAAGHDVRIVYSPLDALAVARDNPDREVVFAGVGFETTTPLIAAAIRHARHEGLDNFSVYCAHKTVPHTLEMLLNDPEVNIDAFILPGHVSTIIGLAPYEFLARDYHVPGVVTGFEPVDVLEGIAMIVRQLAEGRAAIENAYTRGVRAEGNPTALAAIDEIFEPCDAVWRGIGLIPMSGYRIRDEYACYDAQRRLEPTPEPTVEPAGCRCGDVLRGVIRSEDCPLFGGACTPEHPVGPCMVSSEGSCAAHYRYRSV
ncbi:MAG: hydrogenase formation protein HypD [Coriobacteriales bacterium]